jgi:hypothetical protein
MRRRVTPEEDDEISGLYRVHIGGKLPGNDAMAGRAPTGDVK